MLSQWIRLLYSDNGTLSDFSLEGQNSDPIAFAIVAAQDYFYIGQHYPFNNIFIDVDTANDQTSAMSVDYWDSTQWRAAVDVIDATKSSGVTLAQSGVIQWEPNRSYGWHLVDDSSDSSASIPTELTSVTIYNLYWARLKFSADLAAGTILNRITYKFTEDAALLTLDPDINEYLTPWASGKSNWLDQVLQGTRHVVLDLAAKKFIQSAAQILRFDNLYLATAYRTLAVIYDGLGPKFSDKKKAMIAEYDDLMLGLRQTIDLDNDAKTDRGELNYRTGVLVR